MYWHFKGWTPVFYKASSILTTKGEDVRPFHNGAKISLLCMERAYTNRARLENDMYRIIDVFGQRSHRASHFF